MPDASTNRRTGRGPSKGRDRNRRQRPWEVPDPNVNEDGTPVVLTDDQQMKATDRAKRIVLWWLARQSCTRAQLADKLRRKGIPDLVTNPVLDDFERLGLINDRAFAEAKTRSAVEYSRRGSTRIRHDLTRKGVPADIVDEVVTEQVTTDVEAENARALVAKKMRSSSMRGIPRDKAMNRLVGMLARQGYGPGVAYAAAREGWDQAVNGHDDTQADPDPDTETEGW